MTLVPVTLAATAAATLLNLWLGSRVAKFRHQFKVSVGDGGQEPLLRRMRAQANFIENSPFFLILIGGLELSGANRLWLGIIAALFMLARISHAFGMDKAEYRRWRMYGMMGTTFANLAVVIWAIFCAARACLGS
jgi:uncharacterized protein